MPQTESYIKKNFSILNKNNKAIVHAAEWGMDDDNLKIFTEELKLKTLDHTERKHTSNSSFVKEKKRNSLASVPLLDPQTIFSEDQSVHDAPIKKLHINLSGNSFSSKGLQIFMDIFLTNTSLTVSLDLSNKSIDTLDRSASEKLFNILQSPKLSEIRLDENVVQELQRLYGGMEDVSPLTKITCVTRSPISSRPLSPDPLAFTSPKLDTKYEEKKEFNGVPKAPSTDDVKSADLKKPQPNPKEAMESFAKELHALRDFLRQEFRLEQNDIGRFVRRLFIFEDAIQAVLFYWTKFEELDDTFHRRALNNKEEGAYMDLYLCLQGISIYSQLKMNSRWNNRLLHLEMNRRVNQLVGYCSQFAPKARLPDKVMESHIGFEKFLNDEAERIKSRLMAAQKKHREQRAYSFVMKTAVSELAKEKDSKGMLEKYIKSNTELQMELENVKEKYREGLQAMEEKYKQKSAEDRKNHIQKLKEEQQKSVEVLKHVEQERDKKIEEVRKEGVEALKHVEQERDKKLEEMQKEKVEALKRVEQERDKKIEEVRKESVEASEQHTQELTSLKQDYDKKLKIQQLENAELRKRMTKIEEHIKVQLEEQRSEIMRMLDPKYLRPEYQRPQPKITTPIPPNDQTQSELPRSDSWASFYRQPTRIAIPATCPPNGQASVNDRVTTATTITQEKNDLLSTTSLSMSKQLNSES